MTMRVDHRPACRIARCTSGVLLAMTVSAQTARASAVDERWVGPGADKTPASWATAASRPPFDERVPAVAGEPAPAAATRRSTTGTASRPVRTPLDISAATLRRAIDDAKEPLDDIAIARGHAFGTGKPTGQARIDRSFRDADIPTCLTPEAFKFDPPRIGPIAFGGLFAVPFLLHAIVTGRCRH